ncbi:MAG TPA: hypothetical protein VN765_07705, partial [Candidatus Acidoferrum sp.]|nr:hypothetical protein [Candidatus Acidoferrum sp.]
MITTMIRIALNGPVGKDGGGGRSGGGFGAGRGRVPGARFGWVWRCLFAGALPVFAIMATGESEAICRADFTFHVGCQVAGWRGTSEPEPESCYARKTR